MSWRGIHLTRPAYLQVEKRALKLTFRDGEGESVRLPLEDLGYLILDTRRATLTAPLLSALGEAGVLVLGVNEQHLPSWIALPWQSFYRQAEVLHLQLEATAPLKKQLWARLIRAKIRHQGQVLQGLQRPRANFLLKLAEKVRSGDRDNYEALAARLYWSSLYRDRAFRRGAEDLPNALLNYAYALIRAILARDLCALGFLPQLGLHHASLSNAFNLADDLIEPYRPIADLQVYELLGSRDFGEEFTTADRQYLTQLLEKNVTCEGEQIALKTATELTVHSLKRALRAKNPALLKFPTLPTP